jgi:dTDP-4-amino-4,6-dideoxygalactose transaminase
LTSFESADQFIETNLRNYNDYQKLLADIPGLSLITYEQKNRSNYQYVVAEIHEADAGISRDQLQEILWAENVYVRKYFYPGCHQMEPYRSYFPHANLLLPNTERLVKQVISFPTGTAIGLEEIRRICEIVRLVIVNNREVQDAFQSKISQRA